MLLFSPNTFVFSASSKNLKIKIYKTIILPVVLYACETWSLTLRVECRLRVFENSILRQIFGLKRDEYGDWRRLHNEKLHSLYHWPNIVTWILKSPLSVLSLRSMYTDHQTGHQWHQPASPQWVIQHISQFELRMGKTIVFR